MVKSFPIQPSLNGGEISPLLYARADLAKFQTSLARCVNFVPLPQGGVTRRPGTRYVAAAKDATNTVRLIPFIFSRTQAYVLEFGDGYVRFFMNQGQLNRSTTSNSTLATEDSDFLITEGFDTLVTEQTATTVSPYEIGSPYLATELEELQFAQTADVMYITHPNHPPRTLVRTAHTSWTFAELDFTNGPFLGYNVSATAITASAETGSVTLTASASLFDAGHVDALFLLEESTSDDHDMWEPDKSFALNDKARWADNVYLCVTAGASGAVAPVHLEGERWDGQESGSARWQYLHSGFGIVVITAVASATSATATVLKRLPEAIQSGTLNWREGAWSTYQGWPRAVTLFEQRAWYASTDLAPQTLWSSVAGDFSDFTPGTLADDAIDWTINSKRANPISSLVDAANLLVLCEDREMVGRPSNNSAAVKPDDFTIRPATSYGSSSVVPITIDTATAFVDQTGRRLIELAYDVAEDNYVPFDLTLYAEHITRPGG